jgi:hypothetical protein
MIVPNLKKYYGSFKQLINLRNSNNNPKGLMTYNENDIQQFFKKRGWVCSQPFIMLFKKEGK